VAAITGRGEFDGKNKNRKIRDTQIYCVEIYAKHAGNKPISHDVTNSSNSAFRREVLFIYIR
jgi:hypothetical protein